MSNTDDSANRLASAFLAIRDHGWEISNSYDKPILIPPESDKRRHWCAMWDEYGLPHWLPNYYEGEK